MFRTNMFSRKPDNVSPWFVLLASIKIAGQIIMEQQKSQRPSHRWQKRDVFAVYKGKRNILNLMLALFALLLRGVLFDRAGAAWPLSWITRCAPCPRQRGAPRIEPRFPAVRRSGLQNGPPAAMGGPLVSSELPLKRPRAWRLLFKALVASRRGAAGTMGWKLSAAVPIPRLNTKEENSPHYKLLIGQGQPETWIVSKSRIVKSHSTRLHPLSSSRGFAIEYGTALNKASRHVVEIN